MSILLEKGQTVALADDVPLSRLFAGLGWHARATKGAPFDLDASVFLLGASGKVRDDHDFIFYNQPASPCGAVRHQGDNRTGGDGSDQEIILIDLDKLPADVQRLAFVVSIHEGKRRWQTFGKVADAYIRLVNAAVNRELLRYRLSDDASLATSVMFGELYRHQNGWKFRAVGQGFAEGLRALAEPFGVDVD